MKIRNRNNNASTEPGLDIWHQIMDLMNFFPGRGGLFVSDKLTGCFGLIQTALNIRFSLCNQPNDHFTSLSLSTMPCFSQFCTPFTVGGVSGPEHERCVRRPVWYQLGDLPRVWPCARPDLSLQSGDGVNPDEHEGLLQESECVGVTQQPKEA